MKINLAKSIESFHLLVCLLVVSVLAAVNVRAADTWVGNTSPNWNTAANWSPTSVPVASDQLSFISAGTAGTTLTNDLAAGTVFNGLTFQSGGSAFTFSGNSIGLNGGITNSGAGAQVISNAIALSANGTVNAAGPVTLGGPISGAGNLTKLGTSTLTLSGANSYAGSLFINAGTVKATAVGALETTNPIVFTGAATATLDIQGTAQTVTNLVFTNIGSSTITITGTAGSALTTSPAALVLCPFSVTNSLTLNMSGLSSFIYNNGSGTVTASLGTGGNGPVGIPASGSETVTLASTTNFITAGTVSVGTCSPASGIDTSTVNLGTNNTLDVGTITLGNGRGGGTVQFASGITNGTLRIAGATGGSSTATLNLGSHDSTSASDKPVDVIDTTPGTLNAQLGSVTIAKLATPSTLAANRGVTMTSSLKMGAGTLTASSMTICVINNSSSGAGTFVYNATNTGLFSITNGGTANITNLTLANNNFTNFSSASLLSATARLDNGSTLNATTIQKGTIVTPNIGALTVISQLVWGDGTIGNIPGGNLTINTVNFVLSGSGNNHKFNISSGQSANINAWISGTGTITDIGAGALNLNGQNSFTGSLIMASTNTLTMNNVNTYTGSTIISNGTVVLTGSGSITSPTINIASNAVFDVSTLSSGVFTMVSGQSLVGSGVVNGNVEAASGSKILPGGAGVAGTLTITNNLTLDAGGSLTFDVGATPGSAGDLLNITNTVTLNGTPTIIINPLAGTPAPGTYTLMNYASINTNSFGFFLIAPRFMSLNVGTTNLSLVVSGGSSANLIWAGDGSQNNWDIQTTTNWLNAGNLDFFYPSDSVTFDDTGSSVPNINLTTMLSPASVLVTNSAQNYTFSSTSGGGLTGSMTLTKNGTGTLFLQTTNSYTGGTIVTNGTLELDVVNAAGTGPISLGTNILNVIIAGNTLANAVSGAGTINVTETASANTTFGGSLSNFTGVINLPTSPGGTAKGQITSAAVNLSSNATINIATGGTLYLSGVTDAATNNVSGFGNSENLGALRVDGGSIISGPVVLQGNTSIGENSTGSGTISGPISDGGNSYALAKVGNGASTLTLAGMNTYTGPTTVTNGTVNVTGNESAATGGWLMPYNYATATVNFQSGSTVVVADTNMIQIGSSPAAGTPNVQTLNAAGIVTNYGSLLVARGGVLNVNSGGVWLQNGSMAIAPPINSGYSATMTISNGAFAYTGSNYIVLASSAGNAGQGLLTVGGGTFTTGQGFSNSIPLGGSTGYGQLILTNSGSLVLSANIPELTTGVNTNSIPTISLGASGGSINTAGFATETTNIIGGAGSLTKLGAGTLTLGSTNAYTGSTLISAGTLALDVGANIVSPTINVASNAVFDVSLVSGYALGASQTLTGNGSVKGSFRAASGAQIVPGAAGVADTLTFSNDVTFNTQTITFDLGATPGSPGDLINVLGPLTNNAVTTIAINPLALSLGTGTYTLMNYASTNGIGSFVLGGGAPRGTTLNVGATTLQLVVVSGAIANLTWKGDGTVNKWDVQSSTNWLNGGGPDVFYQADNVIFNDAGSNLPAINLTTVLAPASVLVTNNAQNYTFSGSGQLGGSMTLTKNGTGSLTLLGVNTFSGSTILGGTGTLFITNDVALGASTNGVVFTASGTLAATNNGAAVNNPVTLGASRTITVNSGVAAQFYTPDTNSLTVASYITGAGGVTKKGSSFSLGTIRFINDLNDYTGDFTVANGNTEFTSVASQGTASSLGKGAAGTGGQITLAFVTSTGTFRYVGTNNSSTTRPLVWTGPGAITQNVTLDVTNTGSISYLNTGSLNATHGGTNTLSLNSPSGSGGGTLAEAILNNTNGPIALNKTGGGIWTLTGTNSYTGATTISSGGGTLTIGGAGFLGGGTYAANITNNAAFHYNSTAAQTLSGIISGSGKLTQSGSGTLTLSGTNTYSGTTTVSNATLLVNGAIGTNTVTVQTNSVLGGSGIVNGPTTVQNGGGVQGGDANYTNTLSVTSLALGNGSAALTTSSFKIATGGQISAATLSVSGTNIVNILDASLAVGTNTLITYGGGTIGGGGFGGFQLGTLPAGVTAQLLNTGNAAVQLAVTSIPSSVNSNPTNLTATVSGTVLTLSWPPDHTGWRLLMQTNNLAAGISSNTNDWMTVPGSAGVNQTNMTIDVTRPTEFFRMVYP